MSYADAPTSLRSLEQRIRNLEGVDGLAQRRKISMALVVVGQMLPAGAIKGGSARALSFGFDWGCYRCYSDHAGKAVIVGIAPCVPCVAGQTDHGTWLRLVFYDGFAAER